MKFKEPATFDDMFPQDVLPERSDVEENLLRLPNKIELMEVDVAIAQEKYDIAMNDYKLAVAREGAIQFAQFRFKNLTRDEAQSHVEANTLQYEIKVIEARTILNKTKAALKRLENEFITMRKLASLIETSMKHA